MPTKTATSFATVPLSLAELLAEDHAIEVRLSPAEDAPPIARGELGGTLDAAGALSLGLREVEDSGFAGIAFLSPSTTNPGQTDVSIFLAEGLAWPPR